jgi:glycosyltransferase involved in cell wall biosynthesis
MNKLSVVLATRNEQPNIARCLEAIEDIADEIIIFDEHSSDKTVSIAKSFGAKVYSEPHHDNFHITKQKAIDQAKNPWILQLDADEVITKSLADEISKIINMPDEQIKNRKFTDPYKIRLFKKHQKILQNRDSLYFGNDKEVVAFLIPRRNMFVGKPLRYAGVYPDPAIRLIKKDKAYLPAKSVHEIMKVDGSVGWLENDMDHYDSPTLSRYIARMNRYTDIYASELSISKVSKNSFSQFINYLFFKPIKTFITLFILRKGFKDKMHGFMWSFLSSLHHPLAYFKYIT